MTNATKKAAATASSSGESVKTAAKVQVTKRPVKASVATPVKKPVARKAMSTTTKEAKPLTARSSAGLVTKEDDNVVQINHTNA
jgi:hypothetical protein